MFSVAAWAALRLFLAVNDFPEYRALPMPSYLSDRVGAAYNADQPTLIKHGQTPDALMNEEMAHLFQVRIRRNADDSARHQLTDFLPLFANDIVLGDNTHHNIFIINDG